MDRSLTGYLTHCSLLMLSSASIGEQDEIDQVESVIPWNFHRQRFRRSWMGTAQLRKVMEDNGIDGMPWLQQSDHL